MKKYFLITLTVMMIVIGFVSFKNKQVDESESDFIILKTLEPFAGGLGSASLIISYGNNKIEKIPLKKVNAETVGENNDIVLTYLNKFKKEGYKLKNTTGGDYFTTYILERNN